MKKVLVLFVTLSILVLGAGTSLANDEDGTISALDRHAVWTKTSGDVNRPGKNHDQNTGRASESARSMATDNNMAKGQFNFVDETKSYDYEKDHG